MDEVMKRKPIKPENYTPPEECGRGGKLYKLTCRGVRIGIRYERPPHQATRCEEVTQAMLLHRRPLAIDQLYVKMMCGEQ